MNLDALVDRNSWPLELFCLHSSDGHSCRGINCLAVTGWKTSDPQRSQVYALIFTAGLTSETRIVMPLTVMRCPRCSPRIFLTAIALEFRSLLEPDGVIGLKLRV